MLDQVAEIYSKCLFKVDFYNLEKESREYRACRFRLHNYSIIGRLAKITPKKEGQFVTFWKRTATVIEPFDEGDEFDFYIVWVSRGNELGQFVFPKDILMERGIVTCRNKDGKRGFRVYALWDFPKSKLAVKTQKWQLEYFYNLNDTSDLKKLKKLFKE